MQYDAEFYNAIEEGCKRSANTVVPIFLNWYKPKTAIDVGCGGGWWGKAFEDVGCEVEGIEKYTVPAIKNHNLDLQEPFGHIGDYDLAICLEVAEHLPPERAGGFITDLCDLAPVVLFSAAIPGQGGIGHLNEQWPEYWVKEFKKNNYQCTGALRRMIWNDGRVEFWYRQNLIVATQDPELINGLYETTTIWRVVHPVLYDSRVNGVISSDQTLEDV